MRTITMHAMPHGKAAMRAPCLAFAQLRIKQTHTPCAGVSMAGFDWQCSVCSFQCRAGAAKAWRLALSGEAHGGGGPRALQGKAWGYAGGSITRGRAGSSRGTHGHKGGWAWGGACRMGGGALREACEVDRNAGSGGAHPTGKGRAPRAGPRENSDSRMLRTCTKNCPKPKTARGGVRTRIAAGPCQSLFQLRYNSNCAFTLVFCITLHHGFHCVPSWSYAKFTCTINCHIDLASL